MYQKEQQSYQKERIGSLIWLYATIVIIGLVVFFLLSIKAMMIFSETFLNLKRITANSFYILVFVLFLPHLFY